MSDLGAIAVIANPAARGGRVGRRRQAIEREITDALGPVRFAWTAAAGDGERRAQLAVLEGAETILSLGGDGTHNEVVNGIMSANPEPGAIALGLLHAGTGGDFRRLVRDRDSFYDTADSFIDAKSKPIDVGVVGYETDDGEEEWRYFVNIASFGMGGLVDRYANASKKRLGGKATFFLASLRALTSYRPATVVLEADGVEMGPLRITNVFVANGRYAGGGMKLAPKAKLGDGKLDVVIMHDGPKRETLNLTRQIYDGSHLEDPLVDWFRCDSLKARILEETAYMDIDGEAPGVLPAEFSLVKGALRLLNPRPGVV